MEFFIGLAIWCIGMFITPTNPEWGIFLQGIGIGIEIMALVNDVRRMR